jgi:ABC-2 type transport system ATP-binding protein
MERVSKWYGQVIGVNDVSIRIEGGIVALLGPNGAGKSTIMRLLTGQIRPHLGAIRVFGLSVRSIDARRRIGYCPDADAFYEEMSGREFVIAMLRLAGYPGMEARRRAEAALETVGMAGKEDLAGKRLQAGSKGMRQRIKLAQAIAHDPELLVLDEPTSGVDPLARARLWETIHDAADRGLGVLVTTHHMEEAEECDRLLVMADGVLVADGTVERIVGDARVVAVDADDWALAFDAIERAGMRAALVGTTLRVPGTSASHVRSVLGDVEAKVSESAATLEERFLALTLSTGGARAGAAS